MFAADCNARLAMPRKALNRAPDSICRRRENCLPFTMLPTTSSSSDLTGLNPAGLLPGALGEARALVKPSHPSIVVVHDFGETPDGSFFFVMEHVEGADLHRLIR